MPGAEVVAVVALPHLAGGRPEVVEVAGGIRRAVLVVAGHRPGPVLLAAPRRVVTGGVVRRRAGLVDVVAGREHDGRRVTGNAVEDIGGGGCPSVLHAPPAPGGVTAPP